MSPLTFIQNGAFEQLEQLENQAVAAAVATDWQTAVEINQKILTLSPDNVPALNRLARALMALGKLKQAQQYYQQVLQLDPDHPIAQKNLRRLETMLNQNKPLPQTQPNLDPSRFVKQPGSTVLVNLTRIGPPHVCSALNCGDELNLVLRERTYKAYTANQMYIGSLPDDIAFKLQSLDRTQLTVLVKRCSERQVQVIVNLD